SSTIGTDRRLPGFAIMPPMANSATHDVQRWALLQRRDDPPMIILVVDDSDDDELAHAVAREDQVPAEHFGGLWGSQDADSATFQLVGLSGAMERTLVIDSVDDELIRAILDVPHLVAIMPSEIAGDARTVEDMTPRLGGALIVEIEHRSLE